MMKSVLDNSFKIEVDPIRERMWVTASDEVMNAYHNNESGDYLVTLDNTSRINSDFHEGANVYAKFDGDKIPRFDRFYDPEKDFVFTDKMKQEQATVEKEFEDIKGKKVHTEDYGDGTIESIKFDHGISFGVEDNFYFITVNYESINIEYAKIDKLKEWIVE